MYMENDEIREKFPELSDEVTPVKELKQKDIEKLNKKKLDNFFMDLHSPKELDVLDLIARM